MRLISQAGIGQLMKLEGLKLKAYRDTGGVLTIGFGHTGKELTSTTTITIERAKELLMQDLAQFERTVEQIVKVYLTDNMFAALVIFAYNVGSKSFADSTLLKMLNAGQYWAVPDELKRWNKVKGVAVAGLTNRRQAELELFCRPDKAL